MKAIQFLALIFAMPLASAGDSVNNGGGLAEQAVVYSGQRMSAFAQSCLLYSSCAPGESSRKALQALMACPLPNAADLRFAVAKDNPEFANGARYAIDPAGSFVINREFLYVKNEPMRLPAALGYLGQLFLEHCGILPFAESGAFAKAFGALADQQGEQITVGKENLNLPAKDWIRVRTLYSDLLIESPQSLSRLSCSEDLESCSLSGELASSFTFRDLSLRAERKVKGAVVFELEGTFGHGANRKVFELEAVYQNGVLKQLAVNGKAIEIPTQD